MGDKLIHQTIQVRLINEKFHPKAFRTVFSMLKKYDIKNWELSEDGNWMYCADCKYLNIGMEKFIERRTGIKNFFSEVKIIAQNVQWKEDSQGRKYKVHLS